ncbi:MAG: hypothetical protein KIT09_00300 [Bryobacteraceae bacterium]|nr:hypothetical protein [Bryobacteraceae bacterium]
MTTDQLTSNYPRLYHMANAGMWPSLREKGLLSTTALLDLFEVEGDERFRIESCHRPMCIPIQHPRHGAVVIRDQAPMREGALEKCLVGVTPRQWYELLNRRVFLWVTEHRVKGLLGAKLYRDHEHTVLTIDTASLLAVHREHVTLSPINSGNTLYNPPKRGAFTFQPIEQYPFEERRRKRGLSDAVVELAVDHSVPDLARHVLLVERRQGEQILEILYSP